MYVACGHCEYVRLVAGEDDASWHECRAALPVVLYDSYADCFGTQWPVVKANDQGTSGCHQGKQRTVRGD